jgi:hypothetical protein
MNPLSKFLSRNGFEPIWFRRSDFPVLSKNAMDACIEAARSCDRLVMVIDERAGLTYRPKGITISEAEFEAAYADGVPCLVFVRSRVAAGPRLASALNTQLVLRLRYSQPYI